MSENCCRTMDDEATFCVVPIACNLAAIPAERLEQHKATAAQLFAAITQIEALPNGYAFLLPEQPEMLSIAAEFIKYERLCCPFLSFALEVEPQGEPFVGRALD